jgi:hypothetical protein
MKFDWMTEEGQQYPCKIVHAGAVREVMLHNLSPAQAEAADRLYPFPERPAEGEQDEAALEAFINGVQQRNLYFAVLALGPGNFETSTVTEQMIELSPKAGGFSWLAINSIAAAAFKRLQITPEMLEAEREGIVPFASTSPAPEAA